MSNPDPNQIFDLHAELPSPQDAEEMALVKSMDLLAQKVLTLVRQGGDGHLSEIEEEVSSLVPLVVHSPQAGVALGLSLLSLGSYPALAVLYEQMIERHGELPPLVYFLAQAEEKLGHLDRALELLQSLVKNDVVNFWIYFQSARLMYASGDFLGSSSMANLAIYENINEFIEPFILQAQNFHAMGETQKMLESFRRVEQLRGSAGLDEIGPLFLAHRELYENIKRLS